MIGFRDFAPEQTGTPGFFKAETLEHLGKALERANRWIDENKNGVEVVNVETVVLPNMRDHGEEGTTDPALRTSGEWSTHWYQVIRVWFRIID